VLLTIYAKSARENIPAHVLRKIAEEMVMPRREKDLVARDAKRNIGEELLQAIRDVKEGRHGAKYKVAANDIDDSRRRREIE
jgi:hypothetical protein